YLQTLPDAVQKKTVVYHIAEKDFPKENHHLTLAKFGIENTRVVDIPKFPYDQACDILNMLEKVEYFNAFSLSKISELLSVLGKKEFSKGETIIQKGTPGDMFYIITSGKVTIEGLSANKIKQFGEYDTFGEASLLLGEPRLATIVAETDVEAITIDKNDFLNLVKGTKLEKKLVKLSQSRNAETWDTLSQSPMFKNTTSFQKTAFEMILQPYNSKKGETLIKQNDKIEKMFLIQTGLVHQINEKNEIRELSRGDFVGDIVTLQKSIPSKKTYKVKENSKLYEINRDDMLEYIETYPNIYMNLIYNG
ncbi:MAG: cyclic nucleotide-binding domain-containing protein, partial [Spirochaetota bacterium]|nr:cyclic nucleotide-binding domain-containing protein [Spirochaetota bacterium]